MKTNARTRWLKAARVRLRKHLARRRIFYADAWRWRLQMDGPYHPNWWGALIRHTLRQEGWQIRSARRSGHPEAHGRRIAVWTR